MDVAAALAQNADRLPQNEVASCSFRLLPRRFVAFAALSSSEYRLSLAPTVLLHGLNGGYISVVQDLVAPFL